MFNEGIWAPIPLAICTNTYHAIVIKNKSWYSFMIIMWFCTTNLPMWYSVLSKFVLYYRVINTVMTAPYVNFSLYSKKCDCSQEECSHLKFSADMTFLNVSDVEEIDSDQWVTLTTTYTFLILCVFWSACNNHNIMLEEFLSIKVRYVALLVCKLLFV